MKRPAGRQPATPGRVRAAANRPASKGGHPAAAAAANSRKRPAAAGVDGKPASKKRTGVNGLYARYKGKRIPEYRFKPARRGVAGFKAICWNVGGIRAFLTNRARDLQKLVREEKPALLGFLETKLQEGEQVDEVVSRLTELLPDYLVDAAAFHCSRAKAGYSGAAVLVRRDMSGLVKWSRPQLEKGAGEGRTICAEFPRLSVVFCYVVNSGDGLVRLQERLNEWDPKLRSYLQSLARRKPVLLLGDLNVAHRDADIWNAEAPHVPKQSATTPEERDSFGKLLAAGFVDAFAHAHPEARGAFTYWSVRAGNRKPNRGLRLDYAVVSSGVEDGSGALKLLDAFHLPSFAPGGDHCPVGATLRVAQ